MRISLFASVVLCAVAAVAVAEEKATKIELGKGHIVLMVEGDFTPEKPANRIIEFEFSTPAPEGTELKGRMTMMGAGGSIEANIERWMAQFSQPDGEDPKEKSKTSQEQIDGQAVHLVDIRGTYADGRPFGPKTQRPHYRMLAAIITTEKFGNYFVKYYGPEETVDKHEAAFKKTIASLRVK
ncbi:MAG: hypothetical protein KDM63_19375 [Verrucomicrobiae bacterium]|nr:hypothetical protein [Verrucomicrobiae bacterium]